VGDKGELLLWEMVGDYSLVERVLGTAHSANLFRKRRKLT